MKKNITLITTFHSGIYKKPNQNADTYYLQAIHFNKAGQFEVNIFPQLKLNSKIEKHLLQEGDLLFAAKGLNNFAVVYPSSIGRAVASSSFIVIRPTTASKKIIRSEYLAWFISHDKKIKLLHQQQLGTTIPSISMKHLAELEIDIPSVERQKIIVKVQRLREKEKALTLQLEEYKDKQIQIMLSNAIK